MTSLRDLRLARGWTQPQLAKRAGASVRSVKSWEKGESRPLPIYLARLARVFGEEPEFGRSDVPTGDAG